MLIRLTRLLNQYINFQVFFNIYKWTKQIKIINGNFRDKRRLYGKHVNGNSIGIVIYGL